MKIFTIIFALFSISIAYGQDVQEVTTRYNKTAVPGVQAKYNNSKEVVETALKSYLDKTLKKSKSSKGYDLYENVSWTEISDMPISAFAKVEGGKSSATVTMLISTTTMAFYSSLGNSTYINNLKTFLTNFSNEVSVVQKKQDVTIQGDEVKKVEDKISRNQKDATRLLSEKEKLEKEIVNNAKDLEDLNKKLQEEKDKLEKVKN